jgi:CheY-like chemotaxis protein
LKPFPLLVYTTDAEGRLRSFNAAAAKLSSRVLELGTDQWCVTWNLFLPDGTPLPHDQCPMAIALKGGEVPIGIECIAERPDGTRFWFTPYPVILRDAEGRITGGMNYRKTGFEVFEAADGSSAIDLLRADGGKIDVILLDTTIPGASSHEVVAEAANARPNITVILTSAYSQGMIAGAMSPPQICSFIRKPFQLGDLLKTLRSSLSS